MRVHAGVREVEAVEAAISFPVMILVFVTAVAAVAVAATVSIRRSLATPPESPASSGCRAAHGPR
eukprot:5312878-Prymnesium_polylepis.1